MNILDHNKIQINLLKELFSKPVLYTKSTDAFWDDDYISEQLLRIHLDSNVESASKTADIIMAEAEFIIGAAQMAPGKNVLDLGCGPGLYAGEFAKTGACVTGVDISRRSINYAKGTVGSAYSNTSFICMNYLDMEFKNSFDIVTMIYYDFCVLSANEQKLLLSKIYDALRNNGVFAFDIVTEAMPIPAASGVTAWEEGLWSGGPYLEIQDNFLYENPKTLGQQYIVIGEEGETKIYRFYSRLFSSSEMIDLLNSSGFKIMKQYRNLKGEAYQSNSETMGIFAIKE